MVRCGGPRVGRSHSAVAPLTGTPRRPFLILEMRQDARGSAFGFKGHETERRGVTETARYLLSGTC